MKSILLFAVMLALPAAVTADPQRGDEPALTGQELLAACTGEGTGADDSKSLCYRFIGGFVGTVSQIQATHPEMKLFCVPIDKVSVQEVARSLVGWLQAHPDELGGAAYELAGQALHQAYPCQG